MLHECETPDVTSLDYISICCGAEQNEYAENFCGQCNEATTFECIDCGKPLPQTTQNIEHFDVIYSEWIRSLSND